MNNIILGVDFDNKTVFINDILIYTKNPNNKTTENPIIKDSLIENPIIETNGISDEFSYNCMEGVNKIFEDFKNYCELNTKKITNSINKTMDNINNKITKSNETIDTIIKKIKNIKNI